MRPCQHCGKAILLSETICPECNGEQFAKIGGATTEVATPQAVDDRTVAQRQEQVQWEAEIWLFRMSIIVPVCINAGLVLFGYLLGGTQGAGGVMLFVAILIGLPLILGSVEDPSMLLGFIYMIGSLPLLFRKKTSEDDLENSLFLAAIPLGVVNGVGAYFCL